MRIIAALILAATLTDYYLGDICCTTFLRISHTSFSVPTGIMVALVYNKPTLSRHSEGPGFYPKRTI